jgi:alanyl-tRNA synthetase
VEIEEFDRVACGGVHCGRTGEVGIVKLTGTERIRGNVRTIWKIGDRALSDYRLKTDVVNKLVDTFSAKPEELPERAVKLEENLKQARYEATQLESRLASEIAAGLLAAATGVPVGASHSTPSPGDGEPAGSSPRVITHHFQGEAKELFRAIAEELAEAPGVAALLTNEVEGRLQWIVVAGEGVEVDADRLRSELLPLVEGKGGGKPPIWQGVGNAPSGAEKFANAFRNLAGGDA